VVTVNPTGTEAAVCADIARRQQLGIAKYGQTVADNPLEFHAWLQHAYEEALDLAVYLKRAITELEKGPAPPTRHVALVQFIDGLLVQLGRDPTEAELRAAAHALTVRADKLACSARRRDEEPEFHSV
jgi:hypothetical protein